jgi:hypothetical protein
VTVGPALVSSSSSSPQAAKRRSAGTREKEEQRFHFVLSFDLRGDRRAMSGDLATLYCHR